MRVALPQDEFLRSDRINAFLTELGVQPRVLGGAAVGVAQDLRRPRPRARGALARAHRLPRRRDARIGSSRILAEGHERDDRHRLPHGAGKPYLGRHAMLKADIADVVRERAEARGLRVDISTRARTPSTATTGIASSPRCRYTIGIEGGASVLDRDGSVRACVDGRLEERPDAGFDELEAACFPGPRRRARAVRDLASPPRGVRDPHRADPRGGRVRRHPAAGRALHRAAPRPVQPRRGAGRRGRPTATPPAGCPNGRTPTWWRPATTPTGGWSSRWRRSCRPRRGEARRPATALSDGVDTLTRPLIPLATSTLMPVRRRVLGAAGAPGLPAAAGARRAVGRSGSAACW